MIPNGSIFRLMIVVPAREMAATMAIPIIQLAPDPIIRAEMIARSSSRGLEQIRQHALATMFALLEGKGAVPPDYAVWSAFVGEIEAEQRKRRREEPVDSN
jgi:hypothetical protein